MKRYFKERTKRISKNGFTLVVVAQSGSGFDLPGTLNGSLPEDLVQGKKEGYCMGCSNIDLKEGRVDWLRQVFRKILGAEGTVAEISFWNHLKRFRVIQTR